MEVVLSSGIVMSVVVVQSNLDVDSSIGMRNIILETGDRLGGPSSIE